MIASPKIGQLVQVWYRPVLRDVMPYHGRIGRVVVVSRGRPRNHGVMLDGQTVVVPCGNLRKPPPCECDQMELTT
jgi:hypothetical protein